MNQSFDIPLRQLASKMLNKYVEEHWNTRENADNSSKMVVATNQAKDLIRKILPNGLFDPNSKIRESVASNMSTIISIDTWTDLFDNILKCFNGNADSIHGAMLVLIELNHDLDNQVAIVAPKMLNEIYRIFESQQV